MLILARILLILILTWLLWSIWRRRYRRATPSYEPKQWFIATLPFLLPALVLTVQAQSGTLILEAHHPSEKDVGVYAAVQQVAAFPLLALAAISMSAMPPLAVLFEEGKSRELQTQLGVYLRILTAFGVGSLAVLLFWGDFLLGLFGDDFQGGHLPLVILGVGYLIVLIGGLIVPLLQIMQQRTIVMSTMLALLALNIAFTYLLAPRYGALGAAMAYTISVAVIYTVQFVLLERNTDISYGRSIFF